MQVRSAHRRRLLTDTWVVWVQWYLLAVVGSPPTWCKRVLVTYLDGKFLSTQKRENFDE